MVVVKTEDILDKLERIVDFRVGDGASQRHEIVPQKGMTPRTDCIKIFLQDKEKTFKTERDNEMFLASSTAHEADHIAEAQEYFGEEFGSFVESGSNPVKIYMERNYSELTENPALAGEIDNIVKDFRIDSRREEQLLGVKRFHKDKLNPTALYMRPSAKRMNKLNAFREQFLQMTLLGKSVDPVPDEHRRAMDEVVGLAQSSESIYKDPEVVKKIYQVFKDNFDITQPISRLPPMKGRGDASRTPGTPQQGYQGQAEPREGRDEKDKKPKDLSEDAIPKGGKLDMDSEDKEARENGEDDQEDMSAREEAYKNDRRELYQDLSEVRGISVMPVPQSGSAEIREMVRKKRIQYAGEIDGMKRTFRQLKLKHYGDRRDFDGEVLDYEPYMQGDLESQVTGVRSERRVFIKEARNQQRPALAVIADISPSVDTYKIREPILDSLLIQGEALSSSGYPFGLFAFSGDLYVVKDFNEKYTDETADKILSVKRKNSGTNLGPSLAVVGDLLGRQNEHPRGVAIITDGEDYSGTAKKVMHELNNRKIHPFLVVIGKEFEGYAQSLTSELGDGRYSVVEKDKLYELSGEMFRLFKTFGIAR